MSYDWWIKTLVVVACVFGPIIFHTILWTILWCIAKRTPMGFDDDLVKKTRWPTIPIFIAIVLLIVLPFLQFSDKANEAIRQTMAIVLIVSVTWLFIALVWVGENEVYRRYEVMDTEEAAKGKTPDIEKMIERRNQKATQIRTGVSVIKRLFITLVIVVALAAILMTFPRVREIGYGVLASAGVAGLVIGMAATPAMENIIASLQIAVTQPIKLGDVVIIDGEWGTIEMINSTYVTVKIWDKRRLVVPLSRFTKNSFQNWTLNGKDLLGTAFFYVDYTTPVEPIRQKLIEVVSNSPLWDKECVCLQVTDVKDNVMELRALVSAKNAGKLFDLRCIVREEMLKFLSENYSEYLPKIRAHMFDRGNGDLAN